MCLISWKGKNSGYAKGRDGNMSSSRRLERIRGVHEKLNSSLCLGHRPLQAREVEGDI